MPQDDEKPPERRIVKAERRLKANERLQRLKSRLSGEIKVLGSPITIKDSPEKKSPANDRLKRLRSEIKEESYTPKSRRRREPSDDDVQEAGGSVEPPNKRLCPSDRKILCTNWLSSTGGPETSQRDIEASMIANANESTADLMNVEPTVLEAAAKQAKEMEHEEQEEASLEPVKSKNLCVVLDTNVLLSHLNKVQDILGLKAPKTTQPIIFLPWIVSVELDHIKDNKNYRPNLRDEAYKAIRFIECALRNNPTQVIGQTVIEASQQKSFGTSPDDKLLACCLQALGKYEDIILMSNDINLRNKALINGVQAWSANETYIKVLTKVRRNLNSLKVLNRMGILTSNIIKKCLENKYSSSTPCMHVLQTFPWPLLSCVQLMRKHWHDVFRNVLLKHCNKNLELLERFLRDHSFICDDSPEFHQLMRFCIGLCIFLKDVEGCEASVRTTLEELYALGS